MDFKIKTCIYHCASESEKKLCESNFANMGFETCEVEGDFENLLRLLSKNKVDILIADANSDDQERLTCIVDLIYENYCKNILIVGADYLGEHDDISSLPSVEIKNFDLKLATVLLEIKRRIESKPSRNLPLIKSKICELLIKLHFNNKLDGFKYYIEAVWRTFLKFPYKYSMMEIYRDVGALYGKSSYAVEKSMRSSLLSAIKSLNSLPKNSENEKLKSMLAYDMNNKTTTSMLVDRLLLDKEVSDSLDIEIKKFIYQ